MAEEGTNLDNLDTMDNVPNASHLLEGILTGGHLTSEMWQTYKQMRSNDLICSDSEQDTSDESGDEAILCDSQEASTSSATLLPTATGTNLALEIEEAGPPQHSNWDSSSTVKFIDGQITFNELVDIMEENAINDSEPKQIVAQVTDQKEIRSKGKKKKKKKENTFEAAEDALKMNSGYRSRRRLPRDLQGLVGEANMMLARGNHDEAIKMALEVVRLCPDCAEPFQTLAQIYEEKGDELQTFQYLLIAANLCPSDGDGWAKVAEMANELGFSKVAISCYSKAIRVSPNDISLHMERCRLYEKVGDLKKTIDAYETIVKILQPSDGELALQMTKDIVRIHYNNGNILSAIEVMESALEKHESFVTSEEVMFYVELLLTNGQFVEALNAFKKHCGIRITMSGEECEEVNDQICAKGDLAVHLMFATELAIDLRAKLIVTLINLRCLESVNQLLKEIVSSSAEEFGDLYIEIIDAFMKMDLYERALPMAHKLVDTESYNESSVWFRFAQCLERIGEIEHSIIAYSTVVRLAPNHFEARLRLSQLLVSVGKEREALEIASHCDSDSKIDIDLLQMRCRLLYSHQLWDEYVLAARLLLSSDMTYLKHNKELSTMITSSSYRTRMESLRDVHKDLGITEEDCRPHKYVGTPVDSETLIETFVKLINVLLYKLKDLEEVIRIVFSGYTCSAFSTKQDLVDFYALMACYIAKDLDHTYPLIKALIVRNIDNHQIWNLFCTVMSHFYQDLRHNRFCIRLFIKNPDNAALAYFNGHNALMSGSYKHALAEYVNILKQSPTEPLAAFCVSLAFVHLATQKFTSNRHSIVIQLTAFLDLYLELRGECQESFYNIGRAFHQLGLFANAVHFYRKALDSKLDIQCEDKHNFDLKREIAYNLSLIYRSSGAHDMALTIIHKYFVV